MKLTHCNKRLLKQLQRELLKLNVKMEYEDYKSLNTNPNTCFLRITLTGIDNSTQFIDFSFLEIFNDFYYAIFTIYRIANERRTK